MTELKIFLIFTVLLVQEVMAIWPPSYKINLSHEETFVISELLSSDDTDDIYAAEDELIQEKQLKSFNLERDSSKLTRLHKLVLQHNAENSRDDAAFYNKKHLEKPTETNFDLEDQPWESGFVDKSGNIKVDTRNIYYETNNKTKNQARRDAPTASDLTQNKDYNYDILQKEYYNSIKRMNTSKDILNYTETKEDESFQDAVKTILGDKTKTRNCTAEEVKGIGLAAAECLWSDLTKTGSNKEQRSKIFHRIATIIFIWILVYLLVAIPCCCQKGWCCCCFQCKFCKPQERIDMAKKFLLDNPPGVYHSSDNQKYSYKPSNYEKYSQKKLEKALMKL